MHQKRISAVFLLGVLPAAHLLPGPLFHKISIPRRSYLELFSNTFMIPENGDHEVLLAVHILLPHCAHKTLRVLHQGQSTLLGGLSRVSHRVLSQRWITNYWWKIKWKSHFVHVHLLPIPDDHAALVGAPLGVSVQPLKQASTTVRGECRGMPSLQ